MIRLCTFLTLLLAACIEAGPIDEGLMWRDGLELHQDELPVTVDADDSVDVGLLADAVEWWALELRGPAFLGAEHAEVIVSVGLVPCPDMDACPDGVADVGYDAEGVIVDCTVTLNSDIAYHRPTLELVLRHELGHCLGLEDDPPSYDLESIMSDPPLPGAELTDHDRGEVLRYAR